MSEELEALEALERIKDDISNFYLRTVHSNASDRELYLSLCNIIEKELKILEIIRKKKVDTHNLRWNADVDLYNEFKWSDCRKLTKKEYELVKEVLEG